MKTKLWTVVDDPLAGVLLKAPPKEQVPRPGMGQAVEPLPRVPVPCTPLWKSLLREQLRAQHAQRKAGRQRQKVARRAGR